jgi:serine protease Do
LVAALEREGPAYLAGLRPGDVITHIDDVAINAQSEFEEELSYRSPGDEITVRYRRDKKSASINVRLVNTEGTSEIVRRDIVAVEELGAHLEATQHGVRVFRITENSVLRKIGIPENFTIMALNRVRVKKPEEVVQFFKKHRGRGWIYGMNTSRQQMEIPVYIR